MWGEQWTAAHGTRERTGTVGWLARISGTHTLPALAQRWPRGQQVPASAPQQAPSAYGQHRALASAPQHCWSAVQNDVSDPHVSVRPGLTKEADGSHHGRG